MSNDMGLGNPFNVAEGALWLHLMSLLCGYRPRRLVIFIGDAHVYDSHIPALREQMAREPKAPPRLLVEVNVASFEQMKAEASAGFVDIPPSWQEDVSPVLIDFAQQRVADLAIAQLDKINPSDFTLANYDPHPPLENKMKMAR